MNAIPLGPTTRAVAAKIRQMRRSRGLSQQSLTARLLDAGRPMQATTLSRLENGERRIDVEDLVSIAAALGIGPAQLLEPPETCSTCDGSPPAGFTCNACGAEGRELL